MTKKDNTKQRSSEENEKDQTKQYTPQDPNKVRPPQGRQNKREKNKRRQAQLQKVPTTLTKTYSGWIWTKLNDIPHFTRCVHLLRIVTDNLLAVRVCHTLQKVEQWIFVCIPLVQEYHICMWHSLWLWSKDLLNSSIDGLNSSVVTKCLAMLLH